MDEQILKMLVRIKETEDGKDFIGLIRRMSDNNYKAFKSSPQEFNDIHKGQAIALDGILELFATCVQKLNNMTNQTEENGEWL